MTKGEKRDGNKLMIHKEVNETKRAVSRVRNVNEETTKEQNGASAEEASRSSTKARSPYWDKRGKKTRPSYEGRLGVIQGKNAKEQNF